MLFFTKLYHSIQLNLGIKRLIERFISSTRLLAILKKIASRFLITNGELTTFFDNRVVFPVYKWIKSYLFKKIAFHYGADYRLNMQKSQNINKKHVSLGYGLIHRAIIRNIRPKRVLCIGSLYGFIPFMMARACQDNSYGHVDFIDAGYDMRNPKDKGRHYFGGGFWRSVNTDRHFSYLLSKRYITVHIMTSKEFTKKSRYKYNYIYLDGNQSYKKAAEDIGLFWPRLRLNGILCIFDIHRKLFVADMKMEYSKVWQDLSFMPFRFELSNQYSGLGFIQKVGRVDLVKKLNSKAKSSTTRLR